jgi:uncharacterized protein YodC (DUF2158 family)
MKLSLYNFEGKGFMSDLKQGDVVQLKSGGPKMTLDTIGYHVGQCSWFDASMNRQKEDFNLCSLMLYSEQEQTKKMIEENL